MVSDMFSMLDVSHRFLPCYGLSKSGAKLSAVQAQRARMALSRNNEALAKAKVDAELQHRGGFIPLMGHFPVLRFAAAGHTSQGVSADDAGAATEGDVHNEAAAEPAQQPPVEGDVSEAPADDDVTAAGQGPSSAAAAAQAAAAGGDGSEPAAAESPSIHFTDSDKKLFVYMQQWWQRQRSSKKRRKRLRARATAEQQAVTSATAADTVMTQA